MPRKINRSQSNNPPARRESSTDIDMGDIGLLAYGVGMTAEAAAKAYAAKAQLISDTIHSVAECGKAYFAYAAECQRTRQVQIWSNTVLEEARERTRQIEAEAEAMVVAAREETRRVALQSETTILQLKDVEAAREARMEIVRSFLEQHHRLHEIFITRNESALGNLSIEERTMLGDHRDAVLQRLRELETVLGELAKTL